MTLVKIIEKDIYNTLAIVEKNGELLIAQINSTNGSILEIWELSEEDTKKYL